MDAQFEQVWPRPCIYTQTCCILRLCMAVTV